MTIENNAYFWQKLDTLLYSLNFKLVHHKGDKHLKYPTLIYPFNFGYYSDNITKGIATYYGDHHNDCNSIIVGVDILSGECVVQLIIGLNKEEEEKLLYFLNQTAFQKTIIVRRSDEIPPWSITLS